MIQIKTYLRNNYLANPNPIILWLIKQQNKFYWMGNQTNKK